MLKRFLAALFVPLLLTGCTSQAAESPLPRGTPNRSSIASRRSWAIRLPSSVWQSAPEATR